MTKAQAPQEKQPNDQSEKKQRAQPTRTPLDRANEATLARLKATVKAPGTDLGVLTRGLETRLRDVQALLDAKGRVQTIEGALGRQREVPVTVSVVAIVAVQVGDHDPDLYAFPLFPGRRGTVPHSLHIGRVTTDPPVVPERIEIRDDAEAPDGPVLYTLTPTTRTPHQVQVGAEPWPADGRLVWWNPGGNLSPPHDAASVLPCGWRDENPESCGVPRGEVLWAVPVGKPQAPVPLSKDMGPDHDPTATPAPVSEPDLTVG